MKLINMFNNKTDKAMKKKSIIATSLLLGVCALSLTSCGDDYDDTEIRNDIESLDSRVTALESWQATVNGDIQSLQRLVSALQEKDFISGVTPIVEDGESVGYTITFQTGGSITIRNGSDGATPEIGVSKDSDGSYYWTLDGEYLKDSSGSKVAVTGPKGDKGDPGEDAVAPQVRINSSTNYWEISSDGGTTWTSTGVKATGAVGAAGADGDDGDAVFAKDGVDTSDPSTVTFTLADGTTKISVPRANVVGFEDGYGLYKCETFPAEIKYYVNGMSEDGYSAVYVELKTEDGTDLAVATRSSGAPAVSVSKPEASGGKLTGTVSISKASDCVGVLKVTVVDNNGQEVYASRAVDLRVNATVSAPEDLAKLLSSEDPVAITLTQDVELGDLNVASEKSIEIDLNGNTLNLTETTASTINGMCRIENGKLKTNMESGEAAFKVAKGGSLILDNIEAEIKCAGLRAQEEGSNLEVLNSTITADWYCYSTNASLESDNQTLTYGSGANVRFENSTLSANTPLLINVPINISIVNCTLNGSLQAAIFRGGTCNIENSTFTLDVDKMDSDIRSNPYYNSNWGSGNVTALAAIVVGNRGNGPSYQYPTNVTMNGVTANVVNGGNNQIPAMYVYANTAEGKGVSITYDSQCSFSTDNCNVSSAIIYGTSTNITVNGSGVTANQSGN